jgi:hypothetical protein
MRALVEEKRVEVDRAIGVYTGDRTYRFGPVEVLPIDEFLSRLYAGKFY